MIKTVLIWVGVGMIIVLLGVWIMTGGPGKISRAASQLINPIDYFFGTSSSTGSGYIELPWQIAPPQGADLSMYAEEGSSDQVTAYQIDQMQADTDEARRQIAEAQTFGDPSPHRGLVRISGRSSDLDEGASSEYMVISVSSQSSAPVSISGWSLQSVGTGARVYMPRAAKLLVVGVVNPTQPITLNPGATAIISSGASPVGVSFRENICSGYLAQFQRFTPPIQEVCPDPTSALPQTPDNLKRYKASCFDFVDTLESCYFPAHNMPPSLTAACQAFVQNTFTYNGCVNMYQFRSNFQTDTWRLYLGSSKKLWDSSRDIIRLLDDSGRTVDAVRY